MSKNNGIRTKKNPATQAAKLLQKPNASKPVKTVAGSALNNRKAKTK